MVIATQQIGNVIKKNTANSFKSSLDMIVRQAKSAEVMKQDGNLTAADVASYVDYDTSQFTISLYKKTGDSYEKYVCIESVSNGKFDSNAGKTKVCRKFR